MWTGVAIVPMSHRRATDQLPTSHRRVTAVPYTDTSGFIWPTMAIYSDEVVNLSCLIKRLFKMCTVAVILPTLRGGAAPIVAIAATAAVAALWQPLPRHFPTACSSPPLHPPKYTPQNLQQTTPILNIYAVFIYWTRIYNISPTIFKYNIRFLRTNKNMP